MNESRIAERVAWCADNSYWPFELYKKSHPETLQACFDYCKKWQIKVKYKKPRKERARFATYFMGTIRLHPKEQFKAKVVAEQAKVMLHEITHSRQALGEGSLEERLIRPFGMFEVSYLNPWACLAYEVQAYGCGLHYRYVHGASVAWVRDRIDALPDHLNKHYVLLKAIKKSLLERIVRQALETSVFATKSPFSDSPTL